MRDRPQINWLRVAGLTDCVSANEAAFGLSKPNPQTGSSYRHRTCLHAL